MKEILDKEIYTGIPHDACTRHSFSSIQVKFKKLHKDAKLPVYSSEYAACMDLTTVDYDWDVTGEIVTYSTGLAVEIPNGYVGLIFPRSSIRKTTLSLTNSVGVIDEDYRGEIMASFRLTKDFDITRYEVGERCCQMMIIPIPKMEPTFVDELSDTKRGTGGFGSTGK